MDLSKFLASVPILRFLVPLIAGIFPSYLLRIHVPLFIPVVAFLFLLLIIIWMERRIFRNDKFIALPGLVISSGMMVAGTALLNFHFFDESHVRETTVNSARRLIVENDAVVREKTAHFIAHDENIDEDVIVYVARDSAAEHLLYGDELVINSTLERPDGPKNPGEFNYREWLARKGTFLRSFVRSGNWEKISEGKGNILKMAALSLRRKCYEQMVRYGLSGQELAVASALLLGNSDDLDPELLNAYSAAGVLHVLSVSGMHVALIYIILLKLLLPLNRTRKLKLVSIVIQLCFIWFYAMLTGLCPSVLRSVTMLSVVVFGNVLQKRANVINSLAASAFILLLFDPMLLFDAGFQLSYLAVAGIVLVQPRLEKFWQPEFPLWKHGWTMLTVTIAAQLFTFPLGLYYFHQFPTYFLLANMIIIPLSTIVLYTGILFLVTSAIPVLAKLVVALFGIQLSVLNLSVLYTERLPSSSLHSADWSIPELTVLFASVVTITLFVFRRNTQRLNFSLTALALFLFLFVASGFTIPGKELVLFSCGDAMAIAAVSGNEHVFYADAELLHRNGQVDRHISPYFLQKGIQNENVRVLPDTSLSNGKSLQRFVLNGYSILRIKGKPGSIIGEEPDLIFLDRNSVRSFNRIPPDWKHVTVVVSAACSMKMRSSVRIFCVRRGLKFHDLKENGALVMES